MPDRRLAISLGVSDANPIGSLRTDANGQPVRIYSKKILPAGKVYNGGKAWEFSTADLDKIVATFHKMQADGISVPVQAGHNEDPDKTRGKVLDVWRDGNALYASVEMIGEDGIKLASVSDTSVYIEFKHERGGTVYENALVHLACTPVPAVPGLGNFEPLAASVYRPQEGKTNMDALKTIATLLGIGGDNMDESSLMEAVKKAICEMQAAVEASKTKADEKPAMSASVDSSVLDEYASLYDLKLSNLVEHGKISPDQKAKLSALFCGTSGKRSAVCLSATAAKAAGLDQAVALSVIDILNLAPAKKLGEKTGEQKGEEINGPTASFHSKVDEFMGGKPRK